MTLRVIAGTAKGRHLKMVPGDTTRPIMDRVKESLFNIISYDILDSIFIDLYAGTGSVGIEALSRGAARATFIDLDGTAIKTIQDNLKVTRFTERAVVRRADALELLKSRPTDDFDFIYIAPPQYKGLWLQTLQALDNNPAWIPAGVSVIAQIDPKEREPFAFKHLALHDERKYGKTLLLFFIGEGESTGKGVTDTE